MKQLFVSKRVSFSHGITDKTITDNTKRVRSTRKSFGLQATKKLPFNLELL